MNIEIYNKVKSIIKEELFGLLGNDGPRYHPSMDNGKVDHEDKKSDYSILKNNIKWTEDLNRKIIAYSKSDLDPKVIEVLNRLPTFTYEEVYKSKGSGLGGDIKSGLPDIYKFTYNGKVYVTERGMTYNKYFIILLD